MALEIAKKYRTKNVLFLTKKKAIKDIQNDYDNFGYNFKITITNDESMHLIADEFDLIIHDEHHRFGSFPKMSGRAKLFKEKYSHLPMIFLSGTPTPEGYSQIFHQFFVSKYNPFCYKNFYKWAADFVDVYQVDFGYGKINNYSKAKIEKIESIIKKYMIYFTQNQAGFETSVTEHILYCNMNETIYNLAKRLKKDLVIEGKKEVILADTGVKLMIKLHQIYSGTVKFESGNSMVIDYSKAKFIKDRFLDVKIAIFYKFKAELDCLEKIFGENLTTDLKTFKETSKNIALQIVSGREGISLAEAKYLVYYNIDFSATSYWQSRDRLTTMNRKSNEIFWIFSKGGIEENIYKTVVNKKDFTLRHFRRYERTAISE
jgi:hypothetical protein